MKKMSLVTLLMSALPLFLMASGSTESAASGSKGNLDNLTEPGTFPIVKEQESVSILIPRWVASEELVTDNEQVKELEELTNIKVEWREVSTNFREKVNLMFASNDYSDMIVTGAGTTNRMDKSTEAQLGNQGVIIPLNDLIETQSVWFKQVLANHSELEPFITTPDGNIFALPQIDDGPQMQYAQKMWLNTQWLENLGMKVPETTEDFYRVLKAFKERDPNGNGKADELPLTTCKAGSNVELDGFLMNPFIYTPSKDKMWIRDGKVVLSSVEPEYKEGLKYLNRLYREGLIYLESFTMDNKTQINLNESGDAPIIGAFPAMRPGYANNLTASTRWHQYTPIDPLIGPSGQRVTENKLYAKYTTGFACITKDCENPETAFRLLDYFFSEAGTIRSLLGREGKDYVLATNGEKGYNGTPAKYVPLNTDSSLPEFKNIMMPQVFPTYRPNGFYASIAYPQDPYDPNVAPLAGRMTLLLRSSTQQGKFGQKTENVLPELYYSQSDIEELSRLKTTIYDYMSESIVRFISGTTDIESGWNEYLDQLKSIGLEDYLEIIQRAYDQSYGKK